MLRQQIQKGIPLQNLHLHRGHGSKRHRPYRDIKERADPDNLPWMHTLKKYLFLALPAGQTNRSRIDKIEGGLDFSLLDDYLFRPVFLKTHAMIEGSECFGV